MSEFLMPSLGADMEAGTLVEWLVKPGTAVKRGDIIAVVETQKGAIEIEVFQEGTLERLLVETGATVPVGTPLALIHEAGVAGAGPSPVEAAQPGPPLPAIREMAAAPLTPPPAIVPGASALGRVFASPAARRLASLKGIDLSRIKGSGPAGAVLLADVEAAQPTGARAEAQPQAASSIAQMRSAIAAAMARSKREIPHYYLSHVTDAGAALAWVAHVNAERSPEQRLLLGALFVKATALAVGHFPEFNGFFMDQTFRPSSPVHVGFAVTIRGGGLVAPAIHDANTLPLDQLMAGMRDLVGRVRSGRFRSSEIADPTITVSSLGERGVETLFGVIYPPQVAIVGFGKVIERPWIHDGAIMPRPVVTMTLAADHRVSDGHRGALLLCEIERLLQQPESL
ncbi:dihydrolipoamide acetyltransferase family protein [Microvirga sp. 17 mud 1-3]|uniref:dihydrolipoamide acetyltransferase family protein n=1 Tax=Microvirga sp. 17 mud 1-3 TaxID=2082949 RepID=UPI000D6D694C|nr:dihydrolipoamide acetyltransferase family protein [Microvirga sp. 17 mud 1-3]AWM86337.1 2-oxo acid dehydrogenase subunit E2 [Microvirga sp. 17 mud 1-3]